MVWCKNHKDKPLEYWKKVLFSDESMIELNTSSLAMFRIRRYSDTNPYGEKYIRQTIKNPLKVMVWGCFGHSGLGDIRIIDSYMNSEKYIETLETSLIPMLHKNPDLVFQDDNAPCHTSKRVKQWHIDKKCKRLEWPSNSPDLNPIENLWYFLKKKILKKVPKNKNELIKAILDVWENEIPSNLIENLIESMPRRIEAVLKNKGGWIKY